MIVVGFLYNTNGMASWCIETAFALHEAGLKVVLVHSPNIRLPENLPFRLLSFDLSQEGKTKHKNGIIRKIFSIKKVLSKDSTGFSYQIINYFKQQGETVNFFFLNQSNMFDMKVEVPQYVCNWVYPFSFKTYISHALLSLESGGIKSKVLTLLNSIGFYRKDAHAFRYATMVLALTAQMRQDLSQKGFRTILLPPCCDIRLGDNLSIANNDNNVIKIIMCALNLSSKRKNLTWVMSQLNLIKAKNLEITLVGNVGSEMTKIIAKSPHKVVCKGLLSRDEVQLEYSRSNIFLFASLFDDWGYVLAEAMSHGLAVLAPDHHPFNFIVGNKYCLYSPGDCLDFKRKLNALLEDNDYLLDTQRSNRQRAFDLFSRENFLNTCIQRGLITTKL